MDLRDFIRVLRRAWPVIVAVTLVGVAAGVALTLATTKLYQADVQVFVGTSNTGSASDLNQGNSFTQDRVQSYTSVATSPKVTGPVITSQKLSMTDQQLADKITADAPLNKTLVNLHVTDTDAKKAATLANAVGDEFDRVVAQIEAKNADGTPVVVLTTIHPAVVPTSPIKPSPLLNIGLGLVLGLLVGVGIVVLRDVLDNTIKGAGDFAEFDVPVLGNVPLDKRAASMPVSFRGDPHGLRAEAYRQLRTNLQFVNIDKTPRVIAVTSAIPGEGKSTTAMNLAAALAEAGHRVVLIEADLRRPTIAKTLGLVGEVGLTTVLIGQTTLEDALQNAGRNLAVLTSGPVPPNPSELLTSDHARELIRAVAERADFTIVDTAPLLPVADGAEIATIAEATLVVHRAGRTTREQVLRSLSALEKVGERPVGVVLNMVTRGNGRYGYDENYYYSYEPDRSTRSPQRAQADVDRDRALVEVPLRPGDSPSGLHASSRNGRSPVN